MAFNPQKIVESMIRGECGSGFVSKLTKARMQDVLAAFADSHRAANSELEAAHLELEKLKDEGKKKQTLRHAQMDRKVASLLAEQKKKEQEQAAAAAAVAVEAAVAVTDEPSRSADQLQTPAARPSLVSRLLHPLRGYFSPSPAKSKQQQPLGELPASRKRPAPEPEEPEVTEPASNAAMTDRLDTISERTEPSEVSTMDPHDLILD